MTETKDARFATAAQHCPVPPVVDPGQITPAWMTQALRAAGLDVEITSLEVALVGVGQVGETYRYRLSYAGARPATAPTSLIGSDEGGPAIGIVDWQTVTFNYGVLDLAYLIGGAFEGEARRAPEKELLPLYLDALRAYGVTGYDEPQFRADYRHFAFAGLTVTIIAAMTVMRTERGDRLFLRMFDRHASHALDHDAVGLLCS